MRLDTMVTINKIAEYQNGNVYTELYSDGTKIRTTEDDDFKFVFAENADVHISDRCNNGCPMCYANCTKDGRFGDLHGSWIDTLYAGTELAVNLNFPIHPDFFSFAQCVKDKGVFLNATINQKHFEEREDFIKELYDQDLIHGLGISLVEPTKEFIKRVKKYPNAVIHVINGIYKPSDYKMLKGNNLKILILGYKNKGRGIDYYYKGDKDIKIWQRWLYQMLEYMFDQFDVVSFDNLALEQLEVKRLLTPEQWEQFYGGEDGTSTFFINTVDNYFAKDSMSDVHYPIDNKTVDEMFQIVKKEVEDARSKERSN